MKTAGLFMPTIVTLVLMGGFFSMCTYLIKFAVPPENKEILLILIGAVATKFGDSVAYWINSSMGSHNKEKTISNMTNGQQQ